MSLRSISPVFVLNIYRMVFPNAESIKSKERIPAVLRDDLEGEMAFAIGRATTHERARARCESQLIMSISNATA